MYVKAIASQTCAFFETQCISLFSLKINKVSPLCLCGLRLKLFCRNFVPLCRYRKAAKTVNIVILYETLLQPNN